MEKIEFKDLPDTTTPINADNLNDLQDNVEAGITSSINSILNGTRVVDGNHDLNDYVTTGFYACGGNTPANSPNNQSWNGVMLVFKTYYVVQIIVLNAGGLWTRVKVGNNWQSWKKINTDS